jgi:cyclic beta-1,2-glucan synthetase
LIWLPYVAAHYVETTGDESILGEKVPFKVADSLRPEEEERYAHYEGTEETYTLYEHCQRALEKGLTSGPHGLPLMGSGDWNDGMNRVGIEGRGESVWLGWFLHVSLAQFVSLSERMDDTETAREYRQRAEELRKALEQSAWDGQWYRRAYYDDGTPLGSAENRECQIDSIAQSWAVLSGAGRKDRAQEAMDAVYERLVHPEDQLLLLFTPPFDKTPDHPGYIKGYPPGIRENGGQYTHAALWTVWAFAQMGQGTRAQALFDLLNPITHSDTPEKVQTYCVEPYVAAADVYSVSPHTGRGGWTWYTGSSGWMYRLGIEAILGVRRIGEALEVDPRVSSDWERFEVRYRFGKACYVIRVANPGAVEQGVARVLLDDTELSECIVPLEDDGQEHHVRVLMG